MKKGDYFYTTKLSLPEKWIITIHFIYPEPKEA